MNKSMYDFIDLVLSKVVDHDLIYETIKDNHPKRKVFYPNSWLKKLPPSLHKEFNVLCGEVFKKQEVISPVVSINDVQQKVDKLNIPFSSNDPSHVELSMSRTVNLGNYNSASVRVSLRVPSDTKDISSTMLFVSDFVESEMEKRVSRLCDGKS